MYGTSSNIGCQKSANRLFLVNMRSALNKCIKGWISMIIQLLLGYHIVKRWQGFFYRLENPTVKRSKE